MRVITLDPVELGVDGITMAKVHGADGGRVRVDVAVLEPGSSLPRHPAVREQLFVVLAGEGRVAGDDDVAVPIGPGQAAVFAVGEQHTSWADTRMHVVVVQHGP